MRPDQNDLDDEIRGHLAINIKERIDRGEDPEAARLAALREFGYVPHLREEMRRVWYGRWFDMADALAQDMRVGLRSLMRAKGLAATVVITLALGIGANAAIFSVVRGVLLRPLVNRGEDRLIYLRQSAPGLNSSNMTFSVPEIKDIRSRATTIENFGEFSTVEFNLIGLGEPRVVDAGVVDGRYFEVVGLRPLLGRLVEPADDGLNAAGVAVLTHRFWTYISQQRSVGGWQIDPTRRHPGDGDRRARTVGPLSGGYRDHREHGHQPSSHGRDDDHDARAPDDAAVRASQAWRHDGGGRSRARAIHQAMVREHPESYPARADMRLGITGLRDQIASPARPILLILLAAAAIVFIIACSNVANLILARSVRREGELAVRAALGASRGALRRTLLAESLVLCGAGAVLGVLLARPMVSIVARFAARFSIRALEVTVDASLLWVGVGLAMAAAVLLAYVPKLPSASGHERWRSAAVLGRGTGFGLASGSLRITPGINRRLRVFATTQVAFSFVLLAGAATLLATLIALQTANTGYDMRQVLAIDLPMQTLGIGTAEDLAFYRGSDAPDRRGARRGRRVDRQLRAVARCRQVWRPRGHSIRGRRLYTGRRRRESARPPARRRARFLQRHRRAVTCRQRLHG